MASLQYLAFELLQEIISLACGSPPLSRSLKQWEARALCNIRGVCKLTNAVAEPMLFYHLIISVNLADLDSLYHMQLQDLAKGSTSASAYAKALTIRIYGGKLGDNICIYPDMGKLALALQSLCNVKSVM
jgi:hypothetical protein